jgi:polygalacturonase
MAPKATARPKTPARSNPPSTQPKSKAAVPSRFPPVRYLSGTIHLKSNVTLHLDNGAVILASRDEADFDPYEQLNFKPPDDRETTYFHYALLAGEKIHDVAITGEGAIDGNRDKRGGP